MVIYRIIVVAAVVERFYELVLGDFHAAGERARALTHVPWPIVVCLSAQIVVLSQLIGFLEGFAFLLFGEFDVLIACVSVLYMRLGKLREVDVTIGVWSVADVVRLKLDRVGAGTLRKSGGCVLSGELL